MTEAEEQIHRDFEKKIEEKGYDLYSDFDLHQHMAKFINYCEVIVWPDGSVHYAVPNHRDAMIEYLIEQKGMTRQEILDRSWQEDPLDWMGWLMKNSGCICVWSWVAEGCDPTEAQQKTLQELKEHGLTKFDNNDLNYGRKYDIK